MAGSARDLSCRPIAELPYGEWFLRGSIWQMRASIPVVIFFQGGWGKIAAAASTQYVIDFWRPDLLVNLGTCGGFAGEIARGEIILVEKDDCL